MCRRLHYVGSLLVLAVLFHAVASQQWLWLLALPLVGYGFAWVGHFVFEKNRPATFKYPLWSFMGDWVMLRTLSPAASASDPSARLAPGRSLPGTTVGPGSARFPELSISCHWPPRKRLVKIPPATWPPAIPQAESSRGRAGTKIQGSSPAHEAYPPRPLADEPVRRVHA